MSPGQFRAALGRLDITQVRAAELFGVNPRTVRDWISGETRIPKAVAILLGFWIKMNLNPKDVKSDS